PTTHPLFPTRRSSDLLETNRRIPFPRYKGLTTTPSFAPDRKRIALCSSMSGDPEIYVSDVNGYNLQRLTFSPGVDISPTWNPKRSEEHTSELQSRSDL